MIKDLKQRLSLGSILVAAIVGLLIVDRDYFSAAAALVFSVLALAAQQELYAMMSSNANPVRKWWGALMGAVALGAAWFAPDCRFELLCGSIVLYLIYEVLSCDVEGATKRISATLLPVMVVPVLLSYSMLVRHIPVDGWAWMVMLIVGCKAGDSSAYFVGSAIGKHRLSPKVSPNKSWEGAIASIVGASIGGYLVASNAFAEMPATELWLGAVIITNVGAQFGDLTESLLKRGCSSKDSGSVLPAFGGTFDMVDSFLIAAPSLYFFLLLMHKVS
jgi:phosphatidate cytidylyltransferase